MYTEKPIASTLADGLQIAELENKYDVTVTVGHSARLMGGIRAIREAIDKGELGRVAFIEANFSNERASGTDAEDVALVQGQGAGRPAFAIGHSPVRRAALFGRRSCGSELDGVEAIAGRRGSGRSVDDAGEIRGRKDRLRRDRAGLRREFSAVRVFGSAGLIHYEIDFETWDTPDQLHKKSTLYIQRGKDGYAKREELKVPESDMFRAELEMFAESCRTGKSNELSAHNGNVAVAMVKQR